MTDARRIFLIGLSGSGKSTIGRIVAERLGWPFGDTDADVERTTGLSVAAIFQTDGELAFREYEAAALDRLASREPIVISTGGGLPTREACREVLATGFTVWLAVTPERAGDRLRLSRAERERPLLAGNPVERLADLLEQRRPVYQRVANAVLEVDALTPKQAAAQVIRLWQAWSGARGESTGAAMPPEAIGSFRVAATVQVERRAYPIIVQRGVLEGVGSVCRETGLSGRAFLVTDETVRPLFGDRVAQALSEANYPCETFAIATGEEHKTLGTVAQVYDWLIAHRVERRDFVVCLGGGVVTDLAGFAAATCLRGIDFVHVPTSLLAMVDAAIGGKTGVDHARGKNLIGAFAQPRAVVIDPAVLESLPARQVRAGWAEVIKHALILDAALFGDLEAAGGSLESMRSAELISRSVGIKAAVVSKDEREAGERTLLNYGHTVGHALEAITGYSRFLHGEAVAVGMRAAGLISRELGLLAPEELDRQQALLRAAGLPERAPGVMAEQILDAITFDKKVRAGSVNWVLLERIGRATVRSDVPPEVVRRAIEEVVREDRL